MDNNIKKLKLRVTPILPLVYGEELSYMEMLAKIVAKINEIIERGGGGGGSGGTVVYVDGEAVLTWDANSKSAVKDGGTVVQEYDKPSIPLLKKDGVSVAEIEITTTPSSGKGAEYDANGNLKSSSPVNNNDAANKQYVDEQIASVAGSHVYMHYINISEGGSYTISCSFASTKSTAFTIGEFMAKVRSGLQFIPATGYYYVDGTPTTHTPVFQMFVSSDNTLKARYVAATGFASSFDIGSGAQYTDTVIEM